MLELLTYIFFGFIWYQFIAIFGISIGLHRSLCHKQVELSKAYEVFALFLVTLTGARSPLGWIGAHRIHHATADTVDDPHSPDIKGFWKVLFNRWTCKSIPRKYIKDELKNPRIMFFHHYWKHIHLSVALIALLIGIDVFLIFIAVPFILGFLGYGFFNAAGHKDFRPRTNKWINILSAGEGYHDAHHNNPKQVRLNKYDLAGFILETINKRKCFYGSVLLQKK